MDQVISHPWNTSEAEALELQRTLATKVERQDRLTKINVIAGVDVAYSKHGDRLVAAVVLLDAASLAVIEKAIAEDIMQFPYVPGLFSFRELPPIARALQQLQRTPDLIVCDGQGVAHPRRFGLACHVGVLFDVPTIGCGKTRLLGTHEAVGSIRGDHAPLIDNGEIVGNILRTQDNVKPLYISTGHRVSLPTACEWILKLSTKYRLPETTRQADQTVRRNQHSLS